MFRDMIYIDYPWTTAKQLGAFPRVSVGALPHSNVRSGMLLLPLLFAVAMMFIWLLRCSVWFGSCSENLRVSVCVPVFCCRRCCNAAGRDIRTYIQSSASTAPRLTHGRTCAYLSLLSLLCCVSSSQSCSVCLL